ncbi:MAG: BMP family ABC transporter substrate-binding protein [Chloroflexi bacterium]|nr:BMP family ABC transporter substrate-binding protein [Chloroflexota bacterium]
MKIFTKRIMRLLLLLAVFALAMGLGQAQDDPVRVALVATQAAGDNGPIDGLIAGLDMAAEEYGVETQFLEALDPATFELTLRNLARTGVDIIVSTFYAMGATSWLIAPDFPDTTFITIVGLPSGDEQPDNVQLMEYQFFEGAYVGGVYAAHLTESNQLGYTGGVPLPFAWADFNAFTDGARSINPDIETTAVFIESFEDPVKGRELAAGLYSSGVDFIFTGAAASDIGVVEAASDNDALVMVASAPLVEQAPANVAILVLIEWEKTIMQEIEMALDPETRGGFRYGNVQSGEISFHIPEAFLEATSDERRAKAEASLETIEQLIEDITNGDFVVEEDNQERMAADADGG